MSASASVLVAGSLSLPPMSPMRSPQRRGTVTGGVSGGGSVHEWSGSVGYGVDPSVAGDGAHVTMEPWQAGARLPPPYVFPRRWC